MPDLTERILQDNVDYLADKIKKYRKGDPRAIPLLRLLVEASRDLEEHLEEKKKKR